ncbi:uncharacterized protein C8Q71DRAFT_781900 [Rhodofomes roseus]|uniref:Serine-rich protein n=1 Tax=Rhodofomes roseus TaxID=34475 RepID=A0ABQ8K350_9APHY|nr:uncharacterized protein C8Q71DRAFT_781900 [Rhodofomes roseus]KAH9831319.1 hypothetical protein C8Q71DRAFT_781900 [Rhodofomes roseus]
MASVSTWATFGKNTDLDVPDPRISAPPSAWHNNLGSTESVELRRSSSSKRYSQSKNGSSTSLHRTNDPSRTPSDIRPSASGLSTPSTKRNDRHDFNDHAHRHEPAFDNNHHLHISRSSHSRSRSDSRPRSGSRSHSTRSRSQSLYHSAPITPPDPAFASPYTFGAPSPPAGNTSRFESVSPPPLPPLQHPELLSALSSRSRLDVSNVFSTTLHASTYPRRRRGKTMSDAAPMANRIFRISSTDRLRRGSVRHLPASPRRRASAEWSAAQATAGVTALLPSDFGWPAEVAHRLVQLETKETRETATTGRLRNEAEPRGTQADGRDTPACSPPSRLIPTSPSPISLQSPSAQEAAEGLGSHDSLHSMDTPHSIRSQHPSEHDSKLPRNGSATDTLKRSTSASVRDSVGTGRSKRASHRSNPSPVASSSRPLEPSDSSSSSSAALATPPPPFKTKSALRTPRSGSEPALNSVPETPTNSKGKRKAEELDTTPPDQKTAHHATFVIPPEARRSHRSSEVSGAPSSYHRKRARLSASTPQSSPAHSRPASSQQPSPEQNASWSRRSAQTHLLRSGSRASHTQSTMSARRAESGGRRSIDASERSIPISALITPHAPSVARSSTYHMRDPRRLPRIHPTEWTLHLRSEDEDASPLHAWCFFVGFVLFPIWWLASFWPIPKTRRVGDTDMEKAVTLDDPQVEHDARTWRNRCRVMSGISFLTYIPFIVLVAIFVPRHV